jgi:hypothetical protein
MESFIAKRKEALLVVYARKQPRLTKATSFYRPDLAPPSGLDTSVPALSPAAPPALSLACPVSLARQQVPVRTQACDHVQTFGLRGILFSMKFIDLLSHKSFTKVAPEPSNSPATTFSLLPSSSVCCPLCRKSGPLYVDRPLADALAALAPSVTYVSFTEGGKVVTAEEQIDHGVITVTDSPYNLFNSSTLPGRPATPFLPATIDAFSFQLLKEKAARPAIRSVTPKLLVDLWFPAIGGPAWTGWRRRWGSAGTAASPPST